MFEIVTYYENLLEYRSHLILKHTEGAYEKHFLSNLLDGEEIIISDWKMKILAFRYHEVMKGFFQREVRVVLDFLCCGILTISRERTQTSI